MIFTGQLGAVNSELGNIELGSAGIELASNVLTLSQSATLNTVLNPSTSNTLVFSQSAICNVVRNLSASNTLTMSESVNDIEIYELSPSNTLTLSQDVTTISVHLRSLTSDLALAQDVQEQRIVLLSASNVLTLSQTVARQTTLNKAVSQTLTFLSTHLVNAGNGGQIAIPNVIVTIPKDIVIYQVPGQAVTFKPPTFGDTEGGLGKLIEQRTITGDLFTYVRHSVSRKLTYKFEISQAKAREFADYLRTNMSTPMQLTNWKGEIWFGHIVNNPFVFTAKGRSVPCYGEEYDIEVQFEGVKVN